MNHIRSPGDLPRCGRRRSLTSRLGGHVIVSRWLKTKRFERTAGRCCRPLRLTPLVFSSKWGDERWIGTKPISLSICRSFETIGLISKFVRQRPAIYSRKSLRCAWLRLRFVIAAVILALYLKVTSKPQRITRLFLGYGVDADGLNVPMSIFIPIR